MNVKDGGMMLVTALTPDLRWQSGGAELSLRVHGAPSQPQVAQPLQCAGSPQSGWTTLLLTSASCTVYLCYFPFDVCSTSMCRHDSLTVSGPLLLLVMQQVRDVESHIPRLTYL